MGMGPGQQLGVPTPAAQEKLAKKTKGLGKEFDALCRCCSEKKRPSRR